MSKYNRFAKDLDAAFKTSRDAYAKAYSQYAQAERAAKGSNPKEPLQCRHTFFDRISLRPAVPTSAASVSAAAAICPSGTASKTTSAAASTSAPTEVI